MEARCAKEGWIFRDRRLHVSLVELVSPGWILIDATTYDEFLKH